MKKVALHTSKGWQLPTRRPTHASSFLTGKVYHATLKFFRLRSPKQVKGTPFPLSSEVQLAILVVLRKLVDKVAKQQ
jgi:hypothetical protein